MKLLGAIELYVPGERILLRPVFRERVRAGLPGEPSAEVKAGLEAAALVEATRAAFRRLGLESAIALVIDDHVLFQDLRGGGELGDLFASFQQHAPVFGNFQLLRLALGHEETGLSLVIEVVARGAHPDGQPAARIVLSGRVKDFEPRPAEEGEAYRRRVAPLTREASIYEGHRAQFDAFVDRVADAVRAALPEARVEVGSGRAVVSRPARRAAPRPAETPTSPGYDPHDAYYPNPFEADLGALMWRAIQSMARRPPVLMVEEI